MTITVKRIPGSAKTKPTFVVFKDGTQVQEEIIAGRPDVQPAFRRVLSFCEKSFGPTQIRPVGRDQQKLLTWTSEPIPAKVKPIKESKVNTALLQKGIDQTSQPGVVNRATLNDHKNKK